MSEKLLVGRHRRITLPESLGFQEGDKIEVVKTSNGYILQHVVEHHGKVPVKLFATYIGERNDKHWSIICDINGNIGARVRSSASKYIIKDLTCPEKEVGERLTKFFGTWESPVFVKHEDWGTISPLFKKTCIKIVSDYYAANWPPQ